MAVTTTRPPPLGVGHSRAELGRGDEVLAAAAPLLGADLSAIPFDQTFTSSVVARAEAIAHQ